MGNARVHVSSNCFFRVAAEYRTPTRSPSNPLNDWSAPRDATYNSSFKIAAGVVRLKSKSPIARLTSAMSHSEKTRASNLAGSSPGTTPGGELRPKRAAAANFLSVSSSGAAFGDGSPCPAASVNYLTLTRPSALSSEPAEAFIICCKKSFRSMLGLGSTPRLELSQGALPCISGA